MNVLLKHKIYLFLIVPLLQGLLIAENTTIFDYKEKIVIENFENFNLNNLSLQRSANTNYLPEVKLSKNLTSPDIISNESLLIRVPASETGIAFDLKFIKPYTLDGFADEIEFYIYSNNANGELYLYLLDSKFQKHKLKIASLNYDGWKNFKVSIGNKVFQADFIIGKSVPLKITGIQISTTVKESKEKEDIIAIDDILWTRRQKYQIPKTELEGFH